MLFDLYKKNPNAIKFSSFNLVSSFAFSMIIPFMSLILLEKGFSTSQITYFFAIFTFGVFAFSPIIGKLSDEIGRKKIIYMGLSFEIIFFLIYFFSDNLYLIYFSRFLDAIAYSSIFFVMISAFEDMIEEKRGFWTWIYMSIGTIGSLLGPIIAGLIANYTTNKILLLISPFLILFSIIFLLFIPEKRKNKKKVTKSDFNPISKINHFLSFRELRGMGILGILMNSKGEIYNIFFPILVVKVLNLPTYYVGFLISIPIFFHILQFYFGKIGDNISPEFGVLLGVFLAAGSIFFLPFVNNLYSLILLLIIYGIGGSIWNVNAWVLMGNIAKKYDIEGEVVGTYVSVSKIGVFFSTLASAFIVERIGIENTLSYFGIAIIISIGLVYFFFKPIFHHESKKNIFNKIIEKHED